MITTDSKYLSRSLPLQVTSVCDRSRRSLRSGRQQMCAELDNLWYPAYQVHLGHTDISYETQGFWAWSERSRAANKKPLLLRIVHLCTRKSTEHKVLGRPKEFQWFEYIMWLYSTQKISFDWGSKLLVSCPISGNPIIKKRRDQLFTTLEYSGFSNYFYCGLLTHETIAFT